MSFSWSEKRPATELVAELAGWRYGQCPVPYRGEHRRGWWGTLWRRWGVALGLVAAPAGGKYARRAESD